MKQFQNRKIMVGGVKYWILQRPVHGGATYQHYVNISDLVLLFGRQSAAQALVLARREVRTTVARANQHLMQTSNTELHSQVTN